MNAKQVKDFLTTRLPKGTRFAIESKPDGWIESKILPDTATNSTLRATSYSEEFPALLRTIAGKVGGGVDLHRINLTPQGWDQVASSLAADLTWVVPSRALYSFRFKNPTPAFCTALGNSVWANTYSEAIAAAQKAFPCIPADLTSFVRQEATDEDVTRSTNGLTGDKQ